MKTKLVLLFITAILLGTMSCKKNDETPKASDTKLNASAQVGNQISVSVQSFIYTSMSKAAGSGIDINGVPTLPSLSKVNSLKSATVDYSWSGPDAKGWYTRSLSGLYEYDEKVRFGDTTEYVRTISYHGADADYDNTTTTKYIKYVKNKKTLYKGCSTWEVSTFGYNEISKFQWDIKFEDWNPATNAGIYDWYWGLSENSGGDTVPYHRTEHLEATETTTTGWLHCKVTWYNDGSETWNFEYDTPWVPVTMPEIPQI